MVVQVLIGEMLQETEGMCEYAIYVLGQYTYSVCMIHSLVIILAQIVFADLPICKSMSDSVCV